MQRFTKTKACKQTNNYRIKPWPVGAKKRKVK